MSKSRKKRKAPKRVLAFARSGAGEISRSQHAHIEEWAENLRSRDHGIRRVVLRKTATSATSASVLDRFL